MRHRKPKLTPLDAVILVALVAGAFYVFHRFRDGLHYRWEWEALPQYLFHRDPESQTWTANVLLDGFFTTIRLSIWATLLASLIGTAMGLMRLSANRLRRWVASLYVELTRNTPPLVLVFLFYVFIGAQLIPHVGLEALLRRQSPETQSLLTALLAPPFDGTYNEMGPGCEGCHGPGRRHAEASDQVEIINPAVLVESRRDMICEACHTAGHDRSGNFRYPVGYRPGDDLMRTYRGLAPKPGQDITNYTGDNTYEDRHRQFLFWILRVNILVGVTCDVCSADRRPSEEMAGKDPEYRLTPDEMCGTCHREIKRKQREHADHAPEVAGCIDCHVPLLNAARTAYSIHRC